MIDSPVAASPGLPEDRVEALGTHRQSSAKMTPPICNYPYMYISRSPSTGVLDSTLNAGGESRGAQLEESASEGPKGEGARNAVTVTESLQHRSHGVKNPSTDTGEKDGRPDDSDGEGAASGSEQTRPNGPSKTAPGRTRSLCRHLQARPGRTKQFPSVSEITPIRQPDSQAARTTRKSPPRTLRGRQDSYNNRNGESDPAAGELIEDHSTSICRPNCEPKECQAKTCSHPPEAKTTAGGTSALADDATRSRLSPPERLPDSSFPSISGEAQEVFGRGILRIQPHGPRNAYVITFLPDVIQPASMLSTSEMPFEKSSNSSGSGPGAQVAGNVPVMQNDIPIDPLILADDGSWEAGDLRHHFPQNDSPTVSEAICPYPDPPPVFCDAPDQRDSITQRQDGHARSVSSPRTQGDRQLPPYHHSAEADISSSGNLPDTPHGGRQSKPRKRKPDQSDGRSAQAGSRPSYVHRKGKFVCGASL